MGKPVPRVVVCGDIILDLFVQGKEALQYGTDTHAGIIYRGGGSAANVAWWLGSQGIKTSLLGKLGQDPFGDHLLAELASVGVDCPVTRSTKRTTGTLLVLNDYKGERSMVTDRGANLDLTTEDVEEQSALIASASLLHLSGYALLTDPPGQAARLAINKARAAGIAVSLDPSNHRLIQAFGREALLDLIRKWKPAFLWPNLWEAEAITGHRDPAVAAFVLAQAGAGTVVVKLGEQGVLVQAGEHNFTVPAPQVQAVDTTGAGDALCAGFLASFFRNNDLNAAARAGVALAAEVVTYQGARPSKATQNREMK